MTDEKMVPESEAAKRETLAARNGYFCGAHDALSWPRQTTRWTDEAVMIRAKRRYPLTVTRARVVRDMSGPTRPTYWRVVDGQFEFAYIKEPRNFRAMGPDFNGMFINPERVRLLADLLATPTETVDADSQSEGEGNV